MPEPAFVIDRGRRTPGGELLDEDLALVEQVLSGNGFVLLPSDTAFSVAALLLDASVRDRINTLLARRDLAISMAFPSAAVVRRWTADNPVVDLLIERFCPGPITVVCQAAPRGVPTGVLDKAVAGRNRTLGVRIPNSAVERQVAGATEFPVTTAAVRSTDDTRRDEVVTSLDVAMRVVRNGLQKSGFPSWGVIDGEIRYTRNSTVVEVTADGGTLALRREGALPFATIQAAVDEYLADRGEAKHA